MKIPAASLLAFFMATLPVSPLFAASTASSPLVHIPGAKAPPPSKSWTETAIPVASHDGLVRIADGKAVFDTAVGGDASVFRWGAVECGSAVAGDFTMEADLRMDRLDSWNGLRVTAAALDGGFRAVLSRVQGAPGDESLTAVYEHDHAKEERKTPCAARHLTLRIERANGRLAFAFRPLPAADDAAFTPLAEFPCDETGALRIVFNFDSAPATHSHAVVEDLRVDAERPFPNAYAPVYASTTAAPCRFLSGSHASRADDGAFTIQPGGRLVFAAQAAPTARGWTLRFHSEGRIRLRAITLGSAETMQLSDNILWDDVGSTPPAGYAARSVNFSDTVLRFPNDVGWPLRHVTTSGLFFFDVAPAGDEAVRFGAAEFACHALREPEPLTDLPAATAPCTLSPTRPAAEFPVNGRAGVVEIVHVAGRQPPNANEIVAGWLFVYADGATSPAFATLRWNCGVGAEGELPTGSGQGTPDNTWFGPPGFGWGEVLYTPADRYGTHWTARYRVRFVNPHPEKEIACIQAFQMPGDTRSYAIESIRPIPPEETVVALVEPERAAFDAGRPLAVNLYEYRAAPGARTNEVLPLHMEKSPDATDAVGAIQVSRSGRFGAGATAVTPTLARLDAGPVTLVAGGARSSRCSLMPPMAPGDKPFYYTMIGGVHFPYGDFDRQKRLGFDAAKIHVAWKLDPEGDPDFSNYDLTFDSIVRAGLKVAVRNLFSFPEAFKDDMPALQLWRDGTNSVYKFAAGDDAHPFYRKKLVDYYTRFARLVAGNPDVVSINANYGQANRIALEGKTPGLVWSEASLDALAADLGRRATPAEIMADPALLAAYSRSNERVAGTLMDEVAQGIRTAGYTGTLVFNVNFHPVENKLSGLTFGDYLRMGLRHPPASLFHETSERYCLSFVKWLAGARTCGLSYGDECCQPPPTYEHAMLAYLWMGMMQCVEANYCQWWGGRPGCENLAQIKAYHKLLFDAEYLPDPVCLALSLQTGHDEISRTIRVPLHTVTQPHYGLANTLRELDINADRYMIDEFPEFDANVKSRLLIDDITRAMPTDFADRIERFVRAGGVLLASPETDVLNGHAFLRRFGFDDVPALVAAAKGQLAPVAERAVGEGRVAVLLRSWANGWEPGRQSAEREAFSELFERLGAFEPLVACSYPNVFATPYRARNGDLLVSAINITCEDRTASIDFAKSLVPDKPVVRDLGTGVFLPVSDAGARWRVATTIPKINTTVLRIRKQASHKQTNRTIHHDI
ncbi:MAG: hypothetical protein ACOX9C_03770 [Kiritimatiellia bacterium]|jgi:hypothetical protein